MNETKALTEERDDPRRYEIRIKGHLDDRWTDWFGGLTITLADNGNTLLTGTVLDQAALHGLLKKVRDLGMSLISVNRIESSQPEDITGNEQHQCPSTTQSNHELKNCNPYSATHP